MKTVITQNAFLVITQEFTQVVNIFNNILYVILNPRFDLFYHCFSLVEFHHRDKRYVHDHRKNTCPLLLVADYRFFRHMGRGQESVTLNYLV